MMVNDLQSTQLGVSFILSRRYTRDPFHAPSRVGVKQGPVRELQSVDALRHVTFQLVGPGQYVFYGVETPVSYSIISDREALM